MIYSALFPFEAVPCTIFFGHRCAQGLEQAAETAIRPQIRNSTLQLIVIRCLCAHKPL
jgi:hypothetical protein